jgi:LacI family transcriptional regulator
MRVGTASRVVAPLTTVDANLGQLGRFAAEQLLEAIDGRPAHGLHRVPTRPVVRQSTRVQSS